jgi:hypothetical protein
MYILSDDDASMGCWRREAYRFFVAFQSMSGVLACLPIFSTAWVRRIQLRRSAMLSWGKRAALTPH